MNAYRIPNHDASLLSGATAGQLRKDAHDRICDDYDQMTEVYTDAAAHLVEHEDMPDVLRALYRAEYALGRLLDGETSVDDPSTTVVLRELARQAELVSRRVSIVIDERVEASL